MQKKKTRRSNKKYPFLYREYNPRVMFDYIESEEYINGIYDENGTELIRPLTEEEKEWLNSFNANEVCGSFFPENEKNLFNNGHLYNDSLGEV